MAGSIPCKSSGNLCTSFNETHSASKSSSTSTTTTVTTSTTSTNSSSSRKRCSPHKSLSARVTHSKSSPILSSSVLASQSQVRRSSVEMSNNFASPTLSSLSKIKPIAVIKAYDDLMGSKELLEKSRVLVKMKASLSKSPSIERARAELEEVIAQKSITVIRNDLMNVKKSCISWLNELSARAGDANYRLEVACDTSTHEGSEIQVKAVETFASASGERTQLMADCCKKFNSWRQVITNCREVENNLTSQQIAHEMREEVNKSDAILRAHLESAFIWLTKIALANTKTMCYYLHLLDLNSISNVCAFNRQVNSLARDHSMTHFTDEINEIQILAQIKGKLACNEITYLLCLNCGTQVNNNNNNNKYQENQEDDEEQEQEQEEQLASEDDEEEEEDDEDEDEESTCSPELLNPIDASSDHRLKQASPPPASEETFTLFLEKLIATNERILLKLIYSKDFDTTAVGSKCNRVNTRSTSISRKPTRATWKSGCYNRSHNENIYLFTYYEHIYWNLFWFTIKVSLAATASIPVRRSSLHSPSSSPSSSCSQRLNSLKYLREVSSDKMFASPVANEYVQSIYQHLHGLFTSELWCASHRAMIQEMATFDGSQVSQTIDSSSRMTRIGYLCYTSLEQVKLHLTNCATESKLIKQETSSPDADELPEDSKLLMTISLNSYLNWLQCEDILGVWDIKCALTLTLGDLIMLTDLLKKLCHLQGVNQFISDLTSVQDRTWNLIVNSMLQSIFTCIFIDTLPLAEYKCKSSKVRVNEDCTLNILHKLEPILTHINQLTRNMHIKQNVIDTLAKSILISLKQIDASNNTPSRKLSILFAKSAHNKLFHQDIINILSEACTIIQVTIILSDKKSVSTTLPNLYNLLTSSGQPVEGKQLSLGCLQEQEDQEETGGEENKASASGAARVREEITRSSNYCKNKVAPIQVSTNVTPGTTSSSLTSAAFVNSSQDHKEKSVSVGDTTGEMSSGVSASVTSQQQQQDAGGTGRGGARWFLCM